MNKKAILNRIKNLYAKNTNIIQWLKRESNATSNSIEDILISYDFQAGSYLSAYERHPDFNLRFTQRLAHIIDSLPCVKRNIFECGIGEATSFVPLMKNTKTHFLAGGGRFIMVANQIWTNMY